MKKPMWCLSATNEKPEPKPIHSMHNRIYFRDKITEQTISDLCKELIQLDNSLNYISKDYSIPIYLFITTDGGEFYAVLRAIDCISQLSSPVYTVVDGFVASAGTLLSIVGKKRFIQPSGYMLIHQLRSSVWVFNSWMNSYCKFSITTFFFLKVSENDLRICEYYNVYGNRTQMTEEAHYVAIGKAVELTGLCPDTLRKLADSGKVKCYVTPSGQRRFDKQFLQEMCNSSNSIPSTETQKTSKDNFLYARVSSDKQKDDLQHQIEFLKNKKPEYATYTSLSDIGSGINFKRKGLSTILDACLQGTIGEVIVANRDRISSFAFEFINNIVTKAGGKITIIDSDEHKTTEQELSEDILSIIHVFSCKQMGKRSYNSKNSSKVAKNQNETK